MKWPLPAALGLSLLLALILRVPDLDQRPFHNDEAVNAIKFQALFERGHYQYDPDEHHGPLLHYGTLCLARLAGWSSFEATTEASFRWLNVLAGVALIPLLWLTRDALGRSGTAWAGVLTALSPSLVFYNRDYIHESLLVAGSGLLIGCLWRYWRACHWTWSVGIGLGLAIMHTTKETFVLNLTAMVGSAVVLVLWNRWEASSPFQWKRLNYSHGLLALAVWLGFSAMLFSSWGEHPSGVADSVRTYLPWLNRAGGESPHVHSFWFYGQRLFWQPSGFIIPWTESGILLFALVGAGAALLRRGMGDAVAGFVRWLVLYSVMLFLIYALIPYKTPWCILGVSHGMVLLGGVGLAVLWRIAWKPWRRTALAGVTMLLLGQIAWQAWALSHSQVSSRQNPWAYADTVPDIRNLVERVGQVAAVDPRGKAMPIQVICGDDDYWPLPYYLRGYSRVGWWGAIPREPLAPVLLVSPDVQQPSALEEDYLATGYFQLRQGIFRSCLVESNLWNTFLETRASNGL